MGRSHMQRRQVTRSVIEGMRCLNGTGLFGVINDLQSFGDAPDLDNAGLEVGHGSYSRSWRKSKALMQFSPACPIFVKTEVLA